MFTNGSNMSRVPPPHRYAPFDQSPTIRLPDWAESVHSRATILFRNQSPPGSSNLSHADLAATLACAVRAGLFLENQDRHQLRFPEERTQGTDMSIVTLSPPDIPSSPTFLSEHFSPQNPSSRKSEASAAARASSLLSPESPPILQSIFTPSSAAAHHRLSPSSVGIFDDGLPTAERVCHQAAPQSHSFTFSPPHSPSWTASDEAALQPSHHHPAHYPILLNIFRNCWTSRVPGRICLPSEEAAVVAAFVQSYPLPAASAPDWEVSEFTGTVFYAMFLQPCFQTLPVSCRFFSPCSSV